MAGSVSIAFPSTEQHLGPWLTRYRTRGPILRAAESLPLRRDAVTLLEFVRNNKVVGTQGKGNMPLKAIREVTARFAEPPKLEFDIGGKTFAIRSEEELWPLHFLRILVEVGGLLKPGSARRWQVTGPGERFLKSESLLQPVFLLAVWWYKVNWLVAYPLAGMGRALPYGFQLAAFAALRSLPVGKHVSFENFADELIRQTDLTWIAREMSFATKSLRQSIQSMVVQTLADFGALECRYRKELLGKITLRKLDAMKLTPWGAALLESLAARP